MKVDAKGRSELGQVSVADPVRVCYCDRNIVTGTARHAQLPLNTICRKWYKILYI